MHCYWLCLIRARINEMKCCTYVLVSLQRVWGVGGRDSEREFLEMPCSDSSGVTGAIASFSPYVYCCLQK
jgi:hypothetical protein